jgi:hypothetical protein
MKTEIERIKSFLEMTRKDLNPKYQGINTGKLLKMAKDNRSYSPAERKAIQAEINMRNQVREETGVPANNTTSGPGMGSDNSLHTRKARIFKNIYRRFNTKKEATRLGVRENYNKNLYYLQPNGTWKKGGDGRSEGKTKEELIKAGCSNKIVEAKKSSLTSKFLKSRDKYEKIGYYQNLIKMAKTPEQKAKLQVKLDSLKESESQIKNAGVSGYNKPKASNNGKSSHIVVAKDGNKTKTIRFGQAGVKGSPDGTTRNKAFKARHAKNIAKGKMSAAYWANKVKW